MNKIASLVLAGSLLCINAYAKEAHGSAHWSYEGDTSPIHWGDLDPKYRMCKEGKNQSPIDLNRFVEAKLPKMKIHYAGHALNVINNGHTIKVNTDDLSKITVDGIDFILKQFHFHTPSENRIEGKSFPMEAHFVHLDKDGNIAVIAVMFEEGEKNKALEKILNENPKEVGKKIPLRESFNPGELFPNKLDYYRFNGSLTTPPCTEGVRWLVLKKTVKASKDQIEKMHSIMRNNNRPTQPLNAREVLK